MNSIIKHGIQILVRVVVIITIEQNMDILRRDRSLWGRGCDKMGKSPPPPQDRVKMCMSLLSKGEKFLPPPPFSVAKTPPPPPLSVGVKLSPPPPVM